MVLKELTFNYFSRKELFLKGFLTVSILSECGL